jgi:Ca-activated chloride channel family protein
MSLLDQISFGMPQWLWALLLVPALAFLFWLAERRGAARLGAFVSPRLLPQLGATVNRFRRVLRFGLLLLGIALAIVSLAQPRFGYTYEEVKRKGLDLIIAVDTSRSMLANDVPPNRLQRVKLAAVDLITELRGDRIGLIAFAGRAFLQAPLTIDYDAASEALNDLDTDVIPEGGSNISEAINLAVKTFGKSAVGNRALIIFTDGEELAGEATKVAQSAADAGVRIFTVGVGTPEGSFIPLPAQGGGTAFVKDTSGQVVKSKLDEGRLREIAQTTGGVFLPLADGPATMKRLYDQGLGKMQAGDIDTKMSRQPIERYQWPLGAAILALIASVLVNERKREPRRTRSVPAKRAFAAASLLALTTHVGFAAAPGLEAYRNEQYSKAYEEFRQTLEKNPKTRAADKIEFDAGAAAYKMKDYGKALQSFSQALLSKDQQLQGKSHYNLGNTLYQRGETQKSKDEKLKDWANALQHYEQTLKIDPENKQAKENSEFVKNKIEELKKQQEQQPSPSPSPSPSPQDKKDKKDKQEQDKDKQQQQQESGEGENDKPEEGDPSQQQKPGQSPTPTPTPPSQGASPSPGPSASPGSSPSPSPDGQNQGSPSPSPGASASPSPGEGEESGEGSSPTPAPSPAATPEKKPTGDVKGAGEEDPKEQEQQQQEMAEAEPAQEGQMTEQQAERLLQAMKDEEQRVQLDERKPVRRVYKDW